MTSILSTNHVYFKQPHKTLIYMVYDVRPYAHSYTTGSGFASHAQLLY